ncbi:MAG: EamA family transporter [Bacilli bacterium]|nr:EamA family transporter [Bacilli bacterium]
MNKSKLMIISSMVIFGTIGVFRKYIPLSSELIAMIRGIIGSLFLILVLKIKKEMINWQAIKDNLLLIFISGGLLGFNWILLFEAYQYTSVATATLCYYMAPIFVILVSPFIFKERLTIKKIGCVLVSLIGMIFVSGVLNTGFSGIQETTGILFGLIAALFYASVVIINKKIINIDAIDRTVMQLSTAAVILLPYNFITGQFTDVSLTLNVFIILLFVGIVHTGIAYALYFGSIKDLKAQTAALFSYIDPIVAIWLSALVLHENVGISEIIGAVLVLGATIISELTDMKGEK